jgi:hypothetical protein
MKPTQVTPAIDALIAEAERLAKPNYHWGEGDRDALERAIAAVKEERLHAELCLPWVAEPEGHALRSGEERRWRVLDCMSHRIATNVTEAQAKLIVQAAPAVEKLEHWIRGEDFLDRLEIIALLEESGWVPK